MMLLQTKCQQALDLKISHAGFKAVMMVLNGKGGSPANLPADPKENERWWYAHLCYIF
jgi:hypothetical protein